VLYHIKKITLHNWFMFADMGLSSKYIMFVSVYCS